MDKKGFQGNRYKIWTIRSRFYKGIVSEEDETHIWLEDEKTSTTLILAKQEISAAELLPPGRDD